jgi:hypothetical protein
VAASTYHISFLLICCCRVGRSDPVNHTHIPVPFFVNVPRVLCTHYSTKNVFGTNKVKNKRP